MKTKVILACLLAMGCFGTSAWAQRRKAQSPLSPTVISHHARLDSLAVPLVKARPLIGISANVSGNRPGANATYIHAIERAGGIPFIIPQTEDMDELRQIVARLDGLLLTGGEDVQPIIYKEKDSEKLEATNAVRDDSELTLLKLATDRHVPVLGICRGLQLTNVAFGGSLYQDLPSENAKADYHHRTKEGKNTMHAVNVLAGSKLASIMGARLDSTYSAHHQAIKQVAPGFKAVAWAPDSVVEAIEAYPCRDILCVQFHPEVLAQRGDAESQKLFSFLLDKARLFQRAKAIHERIFSIDTHTDTPLWFRNGYSVGLRKDNLVSIAKMDEGKLDAQFLAAFLSQRDKDDEAHQKMVQKTNSLIDDIYTDVARYPQACGIAHTEADARRLKAEGKKAFFIGIENGYGIGLDLKNIKRFKDRGVNYITLCHSYDNAICHSSTHSEDSSLGLTAYGRKVVKEMNRQGVLIDLSHASEGTFWEVMKLSRYPVMCSHSSARALCDHDRNLTDEQLRALAKNGGVVQLCLLDAYINKNPQEASVVDAVEHIDHMVKVAGIDHVGIGSDFDGGGGLIGCKGDNDMINITLHLLEKGYTEAQLAKIWGGNFFRVLNEVQAAGK